ncbi:hypothetical protein ACP70R_041662 [Stipagrostis hirtigluma subsp. patula]
MPSPASSSASALLRAGTTTDLWAKAAELERDFAGYKRRLAERREHAVAAVAGAAAEEEEEEPGGGGCEVAGRGRRYEEYVRRRDERLRHEWRARMERKEAEMKALWARLDRAGSRGRRGGDGELTAASPAEEQKPGNLEVKVKPIAAPVTPRCSPATKLSRPRTSVPSSPAAASPRLSTPDTRRRPSHSHRDAPLGEPPATPRKENRLPLASAAAAAPATPRPRTMMSRSRSMIKDHGWSSVSDSPRPPRFQPPRSSCDSVGNRKEPASPPGADAMGVMQSSPCFISEQAVLADVKQAPAVAPEPFHLRRSGNGAEPTQSPVVPPRDEHGCSEIACASVNADNKIGDEDVDQTSEKFGSVDITGDSDTEPSYVYIKKDSDEQAPRPYPSPALACPATASDGESQSEDKNSDNVEDANAVAGKSPVADSEEASRRESSDSLYSNVQSSFSRGSEIDGSGTDSPLCSPPSCSTPPTVPSPEADADPRRGTKPEEEEEAEKSTPIPSAPMSSVTVSITVQSPMDAVTGLKRFLTFGKRSSKAGEVTAAVVDRTSHSVAPPAGDGSISGGGPAGDSVRARLGSPDAAASDDLENSYVISPHGNSSGLHSSHRSIGRRHLSDNEFRSLQNLVPMYPGNAELKEAVPYAKSPRVHRSFFSFSSFKSRTN